MRFVPPNKMSFYQEARSTLRPKTITWKNTSKLKQQPMFYKGFDILKMLALGANAVYSEIPPMS